MISMQVVMWITGLALCITLLLTPFVRDLFLRLELVDSPDGLRKMHDRPVPRIGGIPIAFAYISALMALLLIGEGGREELRSSVGLVSGLTLGAGIVFAAGLLDDVWGLRPWHKIAAQLAAAILVYVQGVRVSTVAGVEFVGWVSLPLTLLWLVACSNAINLIDGLDGLAAGIGLVATVTIFAAALMHGSHVLAMVTLPLAGAIAGFLRYNFHPASVFLGDSGSLLIGFLLGCYGAIWSQKSATLIGMTAPLMAMAIPLIDVGLSIVRRWLTNRPVFSADRNHVHHKLLERGLTHRRVVLVLYGAAGVYALLSLLFAVTPVKFAGMLIVMFCFMTWTGIGKLGYPEFVSVGRALRDGTLRTTFHGQIALHTLERRLASANSIDDCWEALSDSCRQLKFTKAEGLLGGQHFVCEFEPADLGWCWELRMPLPGPGWVRVWRSLSGPALPPIIAPLIETLRTRLAPKLEAMSASAMSGQLNVTESVIQLAERLQEESRPAPAHVHQ